MRKNVCANCRFWGVTRGTVEGGDCRRRAPIIIAAHLKNDGDRIEDPDSALLAYWPNTGETEWCGEWERSPHA